MSALGILFELGLNFLEEKLFEKVEEGRTSYSVSIFGAVTEEWQLSEKIVFRTNTILSGVEWKQGKEREQMFKFAYKDIKNSKKIKFWFQHI